MASFAQKFASKKQASGGNSIQEEIILESMKQATEDLAAQVSQETSSVGNVESILARGSKSLAPDTKSAEEALLEQELEENSLEKLLGAIELATTPEELSALMQQYEELLASWSERASLLRSEKHLKEYLSIVAALSMLQKMMQNPDLLLSGKKIAEMLQTNLKSQQQNINDLARQMQAQNQKLHEQTQALTKQLSQTEKSLQASIEALKKDPGKLSPEELQATLKQLQESLKQVQELKEKTVNGKPLDFKEMLEGLQKIHAQNQKLIESGKLSETALQAMRQSQQSLQQTLQQTNIIQQLQKNVSALQAAQVQQISQNASQVIQAQLSTLASKMNNQALSPEARGQVTLEQKQLQNQVQKEYAKDPSVLASRPAEKTSEISQKLQGAGVLSDAATRNSNILQQQMALKTALPLHVSVAVEMSRGSVAQQVAMQQSQASARESLKVATSAQHASQVQQVQTSQQSHTAAVTQQVFSAARQPVVQQMQQAVQTGQIQQQVTLQAQTQAARDSQPNNVVQIASATQHQAQQGQVAVQQFQATNTPRDSKSDEAREAANLASTRGGSSVDDDVKTSFLEKCNCKKHQGHLSQVVQSKENLSHNLGI
jgi:hypothetical protein